MQQEKLAFSKEETRHILGIGAMTLHRLTKDGTIRTVKAGGRVLIPRTELERFLSVKDQAAA